MIHSGLDWSGSPGKEHGPWLVFAIVHVAEESLSALDVALASARSQLRVDPDFVFRHSDASHRARGAFFSVLEPLPLKSHVHMLNKERWLAQYVSGSSGADCICDGIITLLAGCPDEFIDRQMLYIDLPRSERRLVERYRTAIRQAMRRARKPTFRDLRPSPDGRNDRAMIQVADMIAGEVREHEGMAGPFLPALVSHIQVI